MNVWTRTCGAVPAPNASRSIYDVSQILAWLAQDRRDVQDPMEWREQTAVHRNSTNAEAIRPCNAFLLIG